MNESHWLIKYQNSALPEDSCLIQHFKGVARVGFLSLFYIYGRFGPLYRLLCNN